ncbi:mediator complex, subunit Med11 [Talaromyces proteolyticus]|uniref:Mediator of RNA polymerase II transcription subunit 11 n=1 Tax=Talaromyces proteolyticus TaxID=1131652 RepID=A0AAD4Q2T5_9EURO|nr:mediator complex, subunit Med11 [Talaromyces proteolyticus]KAH8700673.1 mediator complex, subunit Med11 [Talaromyces proteolyticus]
MEEIPSAKSETFSSADRIRQLNDIDKDVAKLVNSAGLAIQALANDKSSAASGSSIEERKAAFKTATSQYFALLSSIDVRLRRQVYALEEAGILDAESVAASGSFRGDAAVGTAGSTAAGGSGTAAGVFNPLEISWLNSRKDTVGKDKEAESWATTRELVKRLRDQNHDEEKMDTD